MRPSHGADAAGPGRIRPGVALPFFWRRIRGSLRPRPGAAPVVPYVPASLERNPALTWVGHATFYVRLDGAAFLTDPVYSEFASPLPFAGPRRLVPPGVPLDAFPRLDFALLSHDHYDHTDLPTVRRLARRGVPFVVPTGLGELVREAARRAATALPRRGPGERPGRACRRRGHRRDQGVLRSSAAATRDAWRVPG